MCRNIKILSNFEPPATADEVRSAALQFVRKVGGFTRPSKLNEQVFNQAVENISDTIQTLLDSLEIKSAPRDREIEAEKSRQRSRNTRMFAGVR